MNSLCLVNNFCLKSNIFKAPKKNMQKSFIEKQNSDSLSLSHSIHMKSRINEKNIPKERQSTNFLKSIDEEEKNYRFLYQIEENLSKNKKRLNKRKIEFLDEKLKKPYNETIDWKLIEDKESQDTINTEL